MRPRAAPRRVDRFTVRHAAEARASFEPYAYEILRDGVLIARYWHDYRGDEHGIRFVDGTTVDWPVGRMIDFLHGGGPEPLTLSPAAERWLSGRRSPGARAPRGRR